jgi:hypothetical protein
VLIGPSSAVKNHHIAAIDWGTFDNLTIWSATLPEEAKLFVQNTGFKLVDETTHYCPTVLIKPVHDEMLMADWVFANRQLLDLENWDLRMIYSDSN